MESKQNNEAPLEWFVDQVQEHIRKELRIEIDLRSTEVYQVAKEMQHDKFIQVFGEGYEEGLHDALYK